MKLPFGKVKKEQSETRPGRFIVIDGTDGSGKTTQIKMLAEALGLEGLPVELVDFPQYGTKSAGIIEEYLSGKYGQVSPQAASIFYAIDRFDASFKIRQWLLEGKIVLANRYVTANAGHQGGKIVDHFQRMKFFKWLDNLEYSVFKVPRPDLNVILHVPAQTAQGLVDLKESSARAYVAGKARDLHESDLEHLTNAERVYMEIAKLFPNTKLVECFERGKLLPPQAIHNKVWTLVRRVGLKDYKKPEVSGK